jgi:hypothetical protein
MAMIIQFDPAVAFTYGSVVKAAYQLLSPGVLNPATTAVALPPGWTVASELTAIDTVGRKTEPEFFGLAVESKAEQHLLIAIRGTDTFMEWIVEAEFVPRQFPAVPDAGLVEDGFCSVYSSLRCSTTGCDVLSLVRQSAPGTKVTVAGHSLGAAVATLLALEIAVTLPATDLTLYTFASPRVGDATFAAFCDARLPMHFRIENRPDLVPHVPPLYRSTGTLIEVDSTTYPAVGQSVSCYHTLRTYLWLLNQSSPWGLGACGRAART